LTLLKFVYLKLISFDVCGIYSSCRNFLLNQTQLINYTISHEWKISLNEGCENYTLTNETIHISAGSMFALDVNNTTTNPVKCYQFSSWSQPSYILWDETKNNLTISHDEYEFLITVFGELYAKQYNVTASRYYGQTGWFMIGSYFSDPMAEFYQMIYVGSG